MINSNIYNNISSNSWDGHRDACIKQMDPQTLFYESQQNKFNASEFRGMLTERKHSLTQVRFNLSNIHIG